MKHLHTNERERERERERQRQRRDEDREKEHKPQNATILGNHNRIRNNLLYIEINDLNKSFTCRIVLHTHTVHVVQQR